jgi:hypothetical protein
MNEFLEIYLTNNEINNLVRVFKALHSNQFFFKVLSIFVYHEKMSSFDYHFSFS